MAKKSFCRKKGILRNIPKHRIGGERTAERQEDTPDGTFLCVSRSKYFSNGQTCFEFLSSICEKLYLIGFKRTSTGEYALLDRRGYIIHSAVIAWNLAVCLQKIWRTWQFLLNEELGIKAFLCINLTAVQVVCILISFGVVIRPKETIDLLNSWSYNSLMLDEVDIDTKLNPFHDIPVCCKVISNFFMSAGIPAGIGLLNLVMSDLPVLALPTAEKLGLLPHGVLPRFAWQIIFVPLEWLLYFPIVSLAALSATILFVATGGLSIYLEPLRTLRVNSMRSRQRLERMYVQLELFNRIFQVWVRFFFPSWLLGFSSATIMCLFFAIRYTELPIFMYIFAPYTALSLLVIIFWQSYDMIRVSRGSEDILGVLMQQQAPYLRDMTRRERVDLMKRAKVMRPLTFPLADSKIKRREFGTLSTNIWDFQDMADDSTKRLKETTTYKLGSALLDNEASKMVQNKPRFDIDRPRWDQSTYEGRLRHFAAITNPMNLLKSNEELYRAKDTVERFRKGEDMSMYSDDFIWEQKQIFDSAFHPDTGEKMILIGRMSCQVPYNTAMTTLMIALYKSSAAQVILQCVNQIINAITNISNASGSSSISTTQVGVAFITATSAGMGTSVILGKLARKAPSLISRFVPFTAATAANAVNISVMRYSELTQGTLITTESGKELGLSKVAGREALTRVFLSRVSMAFPSMIVAPMIVNKLEKRFLKRYPFMLVPIQAALCAVSVTCSTPMCCAIWPQKSPISSSRLEPDLQKKIQNFGNFSTVYYNKGL